MMNLVLGQGLHLAAAAMEAVASLEAVTQIVAQNLEANLTPNRIVQNKSQLFNQSHHGWTVLRYQYEMLTIY